MEVDMKISLTEWNELCNYELELKRRGKEVDASIISKKFSVSKEIAEHYLFALNNQHSLASDAKLIAANERLSKNNRIARRDVRIITDLYCNQQDFLNTVLYITDWEKYPNYKQIKAKSSNKNTKKSEVVPFAILSDVHCEEKVTLGQVDHINEYSPEIASKRVFKFTNEILEDIKRTRVHNEINTLVFALLGDFISGEIHEDLAASNHKSPLDAISHIEPVLISCLMKLVDEGGFKKIIVPCTAGNHGRSTAKKRFASGPQYNYEHAMYSRMEYNFKNYIKGKYADVIEFRTSDNEFVYVEMIDSVRTPDHAGNIHKKLVRFGHGDHFSAGKNVVSNVIAWMDKMDKQTPAIMSFVGHHHTLLLEPASGIMINGSVIGATSYGHQFGGDPIKSEQILTYYEPGKGFNVRKKIDIRDVSDIKDI